MSEREIICKALNLLLECVSNCENSHPERNIPLALEINECILDLEDLK